MEKSYKLLTRLDIRIPVDLHKWLKNYANRNNTTVTKILIDYVIELKNSKEEIEQF
jgi:hypothetical protein